MTDPQTPEPTLTAYNDQYRLGRDAAFIERVSMALVIVAMDIAETENPPPAYAWYAGLVLRDPEAAGRQIAIAVAADPDVTEMTTDTELQDKVNAAAAVLASALAPAT